MNRLVAVALPILLATSTVVLAAGQESGVAPGLGDASTDVRHVAEWVGQAHDNAGMPFAIVDKANARVFVFDAGGQLLGARPALLGLARGDQSPAGIGDRKLSSIRPGERITPAGRFIASLSHDLHGQEILVIDYAAALTLHPVIKGTPAEHRAQRLATADSRDNRISYGCINVSREFYDKVVSPAFRHSNAVVYILPETRPASALFGLR